MARKTYSSEVEAYVDAELAAAREAAWRESGYIAVSEDVSRTVFATVRMRFVREFRFYGGTALLALLPALVIAARAGLSALPQLGIATESWLPWAVQGITTAAVGWAILVTLWQGVNTWRRARGRPLMSLRFRRNSQTPEYPPFGILAIKLITAVATLPALLWLALAGGGDPLWLRWALIALPPFVLITAVALDSLVSGLGAVGSAGESGPLHRPVRALPEDQFDERIVRLQQIRDWLKDDKLKSMIDDAIGKQVARSERRQVAYSIIVGVLSLVAGWLLSAISPLSTLAQLLPR
jgi:hypothetical protein